jgi:LPXTG-site transpeptidase (sortase) family protein
MAQDNQGLVFSVTMVYKKHLVISFFRNIGNVLILGGLFWFIYSFYPVARAEISYRLDKFKGVERILSTEEVIQDERLEEPHLLPVEPVSYEFGIVIPKINANSQVLANVDAGNPDEYSQKLLEGIAHAKGTVFPGSIGNCYLFSHSVLNPWEAPRYNAQFWLLHKLQKEDLVFTFYQGKQYDYEVVEKIVVEAGDTSCLTALYEEPVLTLQTCTPPGTTWRRLIVVAKLVAGD